MSRRGPYNVSPQDGTHIFAVGIDAATSACPRVTLTERFCGGPLLHEPAMARCLDCGTLWPVRGGVLRDQYDFELSSGLSGGNGLVEVRRNIDESVSSLYVRKRPLRVESPARRARTVYWTQGLRPEKA